MFVVGIVTTVFATALHLIVRAAVIDVPYLAGVLKMTASTGFLATALAAGAFRSRSGAAIFIGLVFSWFGDLFLIDSKYFLAGLISFFIGHVCYGVSFVMHKSNIRMATIALVALLLPGYLLAQWILPGVRDPGMRAPVIAYTCVISIMVALASGCVTRPGGRWIFAGAVLFYLSDIFVARAAFVSSGFINSLIGLPLYFGGQLLLAISIASVTKSKSVESIQNPGSEIRNATT